MRKSLLCGLVLLMILGSCFQTGYSTENVELTIFGIVNSNVSFPNRVSRSSAIGNFASYMHEEMKVYFYDPVLNQKKGMGYGGRITLEITHRLAFELSYEYIQSELHFKSDVSEDLKNKIQSIGYTPYFEINESGGNIKRIYGNLVYNFLTGKIIVYATGGCGTTIFKVPPNFRIERADEFDEKANLYYDDSSAFTINGGVGLKYYFSPNIGLRIEVRAFRCQAKFEQFFGYKWLGHTFILEDRSVTQKGPHLDASVNLGVTVRL